jgi:hypothetical protein
VSSATVSSHENRSDVNGRAEEAAMPVILTVKHVNSNEPEETFRFDTLDAYLSMRKAVGYPVSDIAETIRNYLERRGADRE